MSSYKANRNGSTSTNSEKERANKNNAQNVKNAADIAIASKNPYAVAAGTAVKAADKLTGGKSSEALGKGLTNTLNKMPNGKRLQKNLNKINESGLGDKAGQAARLSNGNIGENNTNNAVGTANNAQEKSDSSLSSKKLDNKKKKENNNESESEGEISAVGKIVLKKVIIFMIPVFGILFLLLLLATLFTGSTTSDMDDAFGASDAAGEQTDGSKYTASSKEAKEFYERINEVKLEMQSEGKSVKAVRVVAVYHIISYYDNSVNYEDMSKSKIEEIAESMFNENTYDEETFKNNLINDIFVEYFPDYSEGKRKKLAKEVLDYIKNYESIVEEFNSSSSCAAQGTCTYKIKGFNTGESSIAKEIEASNIKVRLMNGSDGESGKPIEGEELVDFEKYITGVVYAEVGTGNNIETYKVQAIAARTYALVRPMVMGRASGIKLEQENGQWILQIRNSTYDQVYCDPDQGCSTNVSASKANSSGATVFSGAETKAVKIKGALPEDSEIRTAVSSVLGEVLVDANGYLVNSAYQNVNQEKWDKDANSGLDYKQILISHYANASKIEKNTCNINGSTTCSILSSGPYANWKQYEGEWINVPIGSSGRTIRNIGCLVTSISMLVAKSGEPTTITGDFNPGTFVQALNKNGGFSPYGALYWSTVTKIVPSFKYQGAVSVAGMSKEQKLNKLQELLSNKNNYVVAEVKGNTGQHWVAIDGISNGSIVMMDPGSPSTDLWSQYDWKNTSQFNYFTVG